MWWCNWKVRWVRTHPPPSSPPPFENQVPFSSEVLFNQANAARLILSIYKPEFLQKRRDDKYRYFGNVKMNKEWFSEIRIYCRLAQH